MRPVRYWFNGGYIDFRVPEGSADGFDGTGLRIGPPGPAAPVLRISILRSRSADDGGPPSTEEALRQTRFAPHSTIEPISRDRALLAHVLTGVGGEDVVERLWHLAVLGPKSEVVVAVFSLTLSRRAEGTPETEALVREVASEVRTARFTWFDEPDLEPSKDLEDG